MSDITPSEAVAATPPPASQDPGAPAELPTVQSVVPDYRPSGTLDALSELVYVAEHAPPAMARRAGLSVSELHALRHLSRAPMGPVELARVLGVTSAASSGVVDRLVAHGHAERRPHPADGRRTEVVITESGQTEAYELLAPMLGALAQIDRALDEDEREVVERYLRGATAALRSVM